MVVLFIIAQLNLIANIVYLFSHMALLCSTRLMKVVHKLNCATISMHYMAASCVPFAIEKHSVRHKIIRTTE